MLSLHTLHRDLVVKFSTNEERDEVASIIEDEIKRKQGHGVSVLLMEALNAKDLEQSIELLDNGCDPNAKNAMGDQPIHIVARKDMHAILDRLITAGADVNGKGQYGMTALHIAAARETSSLSMHLITAGAHLNAVDSLGGGTALHHAVNAGAAETVKLLLEAGADQKALDSNGKTPFHLAKVLCSDLRNGSSRSSINDCLSRKENMDAVFELLKDTECIKAT